MGSISLCLTWNRDLQRVSAALKLNKLLGHNPNTHQSYPSHEILTLKIAAGSKTRLKIPFLEMKFGKASNPGEMRERSAGQSGGRTAFLQGTTRKTQLPELGFGSSMCWGAGHLLSWQSCPVNPGWQEQVPVVGSQSPPSQAQELAQPWPQWPLLQAAKGNRVTSSTTPTLLHFHVTQLRIHSMAKD